MTQMGGLNGTLPLYGKALVPVVAMTRKAVAVETMRAVPAPLPAERARPAKEDSAAAAARTLAAAVRALALREAGAAARTAGEDDPAPKQPEAVEVSVMMARLMNGGGLPVLPEPPTPARDAFVEAVLALRSGIRRDGTAAALSGRA